MQFQILAFTALLSTALAAPAGLLSTRQSSSPGWTIRSFTRNCTDPNICTYTFSIDVNNGSSTPVPCTIVDTAEPATTHSFYGVPCTQANNFAVSWGWNTQDDFTVLTLVNQTALQEAFFGYDHPNVGLPVVSYADVGPNAVQHT
ncbi:hypothetical protein M430DRAFT_58917 [Amorphotheca resinae ATCC 22711]|uniref:Uncharacterized protein n=1 Tax=Amorphotheca resinae ATCC 22711 TaxID=857342 RepID=A0A2T3B2P3_AMORE|nr:hypothetical protein M430DRAFT_58917 [Amorphotheca resinae ATCC 22711]PSS18826.1 hypothetical protein M430DRAFT_58917 [Amorphotheca resinae ATCC 22711]